MLVGIYDSGIGGVPVLRKLQEKYPYLDFVYYADNMYFPYGNKTNAEIKRLASTAINRLIDSYKVSMVIIACHSICSAIYAESFQVPIYSISHGYINYLCESFSKKNIAIFSTPTSAIFHKKALQESGFIGEVHSVECYGLAELIEGDVDKNVIIEYLQNIKIADSVDMVIYGCTHYPLLSRLIERVIDRDIQYIDPADYIMLDSVMASSGIGKVIYHSTGKDIDFKNKYLKQIGLDDNFHK